MRLFYFLMCLILLPGCSKKEAVQAPLRQPQAPTQSLPPSPQPTYTIPPVQTPSTTVQQPQRIQSGETEVAAAYLTWFRDFENRRKQMEANHTSELQQQNEAVIRDLTTARSMGPLGSDPQPENQNALGAFARVGQRMAADWQRLAVEFRQKAPPPSCQALAAAYAQALRMNAAYALDVMQSFQQQMNAIQQGRRVSEAQQAEARRQSAHGQQQINALYQQAQTELAGIRLNLPNLPPDATNFRIGS